jgi:hypothetical protein
VHESVDGPIERVRKGGVPGGGPWGGGREREHRHGVSSIGSEATYRVQIVAVHCSRKDMPQRCPAPHSSQPPSCARHDSLHPPTQ